MRDYAKNNYKTSLKRKKSQRHRKPKFGLIFSVLVFAAVFASGLFWLHFNPGLLPASSTKALHHQSQKTMAKPNQVVLATPRNHFDFYTMLPQQEVPVANVDSAPASVPAHPVTQEYFLQIGAFADLSSADALKAKLTLAGFAPKIQPIQNQNQLLYRVYLGPYPSALAREQQKAALADRMHQPPVDSQNLPP